MTEQSPKKTPIIFPPENSTIIVVQANENKTVHIKNPGNYVVHLNGVGAHVHIQAAFLTEGKTQLELNLYIIHEAAHTSAQTTLKGVAKDQSRIRFFGRIKIEPNCPGVQSFLEERILLLSEKASAEAVPELEILSDDVKCSHAASISQIPEEHLFYLQSRGISRTNAEELVTNGFLTLPE
ncbi:hypothetical protein BH10PAT2_BH10PAT2_3030 [soil metagenome]